MKKQLLQLILILAITLLPASVFAASSADIQKDIEKTKKITQDAKDDIVAKEKELASIKENIIEAEQEKEEAYALTAKQIKAIYENAPTSLSYVISQHFAGKLSAAAYAQEVLIIDYKHLQEINDNVKEAKVKKTKKEKEIVKLKKRQKTAEDDTKRLEARLQSAKKKENDEKVAKYMAFLPEHDSSYTLEGWKPDPDGSKLTKLGGVNYYYNQKETYYNMDMSNIVKSLTARDSWLWPQICKAGNQKNFKKSYKYWIRPDGVKMFGPYVMIAAKLSVHKRGSLMPTSLGMGVVVDTGGFAHTANGAHWVDIATNW